MQSGLQTSAVDQEVNEWTLGLFCFVPRVPHHQDDNVLQEQTVIWKEGRPFTDKIYICEIHTHTKKDWRHTKRKINAYNRGMHSNSVNYCKWISQNHCLNKKYIPPATISLFGLTEQKMMMLFFLLLFGLLSDFFYTKLFKLEILSNSYNRGHGMSTRHTINLRNLSHYLVQSFNFSLTNEINGNKWEGGVSM